MLQVPIGEQVSVLDVLCDGVGRYGIIHVHLYSNDYTPGPTTVLDDFVESAFDGYAAVTLNDKWGAAYVAGDGRARADATALAEFDQDGGAATETAYGYYITDSLDTSLFWAERFPAPIPMLNVMSHIGLLLRLENLGFNGGALVSS